MNTVCDCWTKSFLVFSLFEHFFKRCHQNEWDFSLLWFQYEIFWLWSSSLEKNQIKSMFSTMKPILRDPAFVEKIFIVFFLFTGFFLYGRISIFVLWMKIGLTKVIIMMMMMMMWLRLVCPQGHLVDDRYRRPTATETKKSASSMPQATE